MKTPIIELLAVATQTALAALKQEDTVTPANVEVGDTFNLTLANEAGATHQISYVAAAATVADVTAGLHAAAVAAKAAPDPPWAEVTTTDNNTSLSVVHDTFGHRTLAASATNGGANDTQTLAIENVKDITPKSIIRPTIKGLKKSPDDYDVVMLQGPADHAEEYDIENGYAWRQVMTYACTRRLSDENDAPVDKQLNSFAAAISARMYESFSDDQFEGYALYIEETARGFDEDEDNGTEAITLIFDLINRHVYGDPYSVI